MTERDPVDAARRADRTALTETEAKAVLADAGVPIPDGEVVGTAGEAAAAADELGYPVVVKVSSPAVAHKSEWGGGAGVALDLDSPAAVRAAAENVLAAADRADVDAGVLVEEAVDTDAGTEVVVGGVRDPSFGPAVAVGLGGVLAEVLDDASHRLAPVGDEEAGAMLEELRGSALLSGYRDRPAVDREALAATVRRVGDLLVAREAVLEVEANPVLATAGGVVALDAFVRLVGEGKP